MENKQRPVIAETRELVQKYHVLEKAQIYAYFALDGRDHFVGKAFKALEKERQVFIHPELEVVAASEEAIAAKDLGTMKAVWVLGDEKETSGRTLSCFEGRVSGTDRILRRGRNL